MCGSSDGPGQYHHDDGPSGSTSTDSVKISLAVLAGIAGTLACIFLGPIILCVGFAAAILLIIAWIIYSIPKSIYESQKAKREFRENLDRRYAEILEKRRQREQKNPPPPEGE